MCGATQCFKAFLFQKRSKTKKFQFKSAAPSLHSIKLYIIRLLFLQETKTPNKREGPEHWGYLPHDRELGGRKGVFSRNTDGFERREHSSGHPSRVQTEDGVQRQHGEYTQL